ncbi:MAG TPA: patatin-like phospholipase family protein [Thermoanaerobaculia bacterium]|nr:patatin-like phospholipase family protein [Thermoanaerobaculia bacterium]
MKTDELDPSFLRSARRIGFVFSGGSSRCAFQVGVIETLAELGIRPALCVGLSVGAWNAAAVAAGTGHRLRHYWRAFVRMPPWDLSNLLREQTPFRFAEIHRRTFSRYVGAQRLHAPDALPLFIGLTRLRDGASVCFDARTVEDPFLLLLASNFLPPYYTRTPLIQGERYGDGGLTNNIPYEKAFAEGCDAVVLVANKGESEGGLFRNPAEPLHEIPSPWRERTLVIRPRHRLPVAFAERRWSILSGIVEIGRLRAREVLLGESHPDVTEVRGEPPFFGTLLVHVARARAFLARRAAARRPISPSDPPV